MKKEAGKRSKLWLWLAIGLAAVLVITGTVLGIVLLSGQGGKTKDDGRPDLYWNLDREAYMTKDSLSSSREKAEDGLYHIRFAFDGEVVELTTADKQLVNFIDTMNAMGLTFDGDGYIVDAVAVKEVSTVIAEDVFVQSVGDGVININSSVVMNGLKRAIEPAALTEIYDVVSKDENAGQVIAIEDLNIMDRLCIYGDAEGNVTHVFVASHSRESKVYWRANQFVSSGKTTRVPDKDGYYTIPFWCEGEYVELKCNNVVEVNYIDKQSYYSSHFGLVFDDDGYITEAIHSYEAIRGVIRSERHDVTEIDGNTISTAKIIGSNAGATDKFTIDENVKLYDVSPAAVSEGRAGLPVESLCVGDRIVCFADAEGKPLFVYITEHVVEEAVWCYNIERKYDSTLQQTKRVPVDGWYTFKVFAEGVVRYVKTQDLATANAMDSVGAAVFGLTLDGDVVKHVYNVRAVFGYTHFGQGRYITGITGSIFSCFKTSAPDKLISGIMAPDCKIWNLSSVGTYGEETKLQKGDYIFAYQTSDLTIRQIFVMRRTVDLPIYISAARKYDSATKKTTREKDAENWYVFEVYRDGKKLTVKTKSEALANKMDAINPAVMALSVGNDGIVYDAYEANLVYGGYRRAHGYTVTAIVGNTVETSYQGADGNIATRTLTLADDCKTLDMTLNIGQSTKVRVGDVITAFADIYEETKLMVVRNRKVDYLYWNQLKMYDDTNDVTMRKTDDENWYVYTLLRSDGEIVTLKTQDPAVANKVDYYGGAFTLNVKDGIILSAGSSSFGKNTNGSNLANYDVVAINGKTVTLTNGKETVKITLSSDCKIYEVGPDAATFGAVTQLKVGDRVRAYMSDKNKTYTYVFVRFHDSRELGVNGHCDICKKDVKWEPWVGGSFSTAGGHFYLPADITTDYLPCSTGRRKEFPVSTVCLDLNGHTYYRTSGRAMYVYTNGTLNIMDTVGGGTITSDGIDKGTVGGVLGVAGGTVNFYSGTLRLADAHSVQYRAGVVYVTKGSDKETTPGTLNMYGGVIENGEVLSRGGNVDVNGGIFNMYGGVIRDGVVGEGYEEDTTCYGGNISIRGNSIFNMYGGTISGGEAYKNGGNIYSGTGVTTIYGGTITGGVTKVAGGGNIYATEKLFIEGGTISGGVSQKASGGNIYVAKNNDNSALTMTGGTVTGGTSANYGGNIYSEGVTLLSDVVITDGKASNGGNLYVNKETVITDCTLSGGVTTAAKGSGGNIYVGGNKLVLENTTITGGISGGRGGNIYSAGAEIVMLSGTVSNGVSGLGNTNGGGNICTVSNGVFYLVDGTVFGGVSANTGGNILAGSGGLQILGGTVTGGTAPTAGADVYVYGGSTDVVLCGGNLGTVEIAAVKSLVMAEKPVLEALILGGGVVADITELDKNAQIPLMASGVIATALEAPEDYMGCFVPAEEGYALYVDGDALAIGAGVKKAQCDHCDDTVHWHLWNGTGTNGHYYLDGQLEVTAETEISVGNTFVLDLAGNTLTNAEGRVFTVQGDLVILDSVGGGKVIGSYAGTENGGVIYVDNGRFDLYDGTVSYNKTAAGANRGGVLYMQGASVVNLHSGVIADGKTTERGGNIYVGGGELNLCGATVQNGTANSSNAYGGGNIFMLGDSVTTMTAGKVIGGTTTKTGGNICVGTATFIMEGGEISGGNADVAAPDVYVYYNKGNAEIKGGTIASLTYKDANSFKLSGNPVITELDIASGKLVELGELTTGADIKIKATGVFTTENENAQNFVDAKYVKAASAAYQITVVDNKLSVTEAPLIPEGAIQAFCEHCGEDAIWYKWNGIATNGHFYLDTDVEQTQTDGIVIPKENTLVLDLAGKKITGNKVRAFTVNGNLFVSDSVGGGEVVTGGGTTKNYLGGVIFAQEGTFTLYSGTLRLADEHSATIQRGGVIYVDKAAHVTIKGGTVKNGVTTDRGGNIYVVGSNTTTGGGLTVEGGLITNGTAGSGNANGGGNIAVLGGSTVEIKGGVVSNGYSPKTAGNILATGNLIISGGEIYGGEAVGNAQNIYVTNGSGDVTITGGTIESLTANNAKSLTISGEPVIGELELMSGQKVTLGALEENADILVKANGIFTEANPNAEAYVTAGIIRCYDRFEITAANNQLSVAFATNSYCAHCEKTVAWSAWDGEETNGHFYLTENKTPTAVINIVAGEKLVLDLCGYNITNTSGRTFYVYGELAILDCIGTGVVTGSQAGDSMQGGVVRVRGGKFDLYAGTIRYNPEAAGAKQGGVIYAQVYNEVGATVNLYGGVIEGGKTLERGGNIYADGAGTEVNLIGATIQNGHAGAANNAVGGGNVFVINGAVFKMTGGKIIDGTADNFGGNVGVGSGTFIMEGGEISGGTAATRAPSVYVYYSGGSFEMKGGKINSITYKDAASFKISGNPVIGKLEITAGKLVTLGDLTAGADITVDGEGAFTTANAKAADFVAAEQIKAVEGKALSEENGVLSVAASVANKSLLARFIEAIF